MKQIIRASLATIKLCLKEQTYFGVIYLLGQYVLQAAVLGALLMIWRSLFMQGVDLEGMTLNQLYAYTILSTVLAPMLNVRTPASGWLHDGTMLGLYQRPAGVFMQLAAHTIGGWAMRLLCLSIPVALIAVLCGVDLRPASPWRFCRALQWIICSPACSFVCAIWNGACIVCAKRSPHCLPVPSFPSPRCHGVLADGCRCRPSARWPVRRWPSIQDLATQPRFCLRRSCGI